jgi:hypothetical protein
LTTHVYKTIEDLNKDWAKRSQIIHEKYEMQMKMFMERHLTDLEKKDKEIIRVREETAADYEFRINNLEEEIKRLRDLADALEREHAENESLLD